MGYEKKKRGVWIKKRVYNRLFTKRIIIIIINA
nr:MAG TPA: hypothetical protein [Caudoviricetes sp.]